MLEYQNLLTPELIWNIEQNKPSLVAKDLQAFGVPSKITHSILLARGVYKWLSVRRQLIKLKNVWKTRISETLAKLKEAKRERNGYEVGYLRGYLKAYEECRAEVRTLCHSKRWQAPDFDRQAQAHLRSLIPREPDLEKLGSCLRCGCRPCVCEEKYGKEKAG